MSNPKLFVILIKKGHFSSNNLGGVVFRRMQVRQISWLLATQPAFPHRQVLHEGDQRMYRQHRKSQLLHLLNTRPNLKILADETGRTIATLDSLYHSGMRPVPLDHLTHGSTLMSSKLSMVNRTSTARFTKRIDSHQWRANPHQHLEKNLEAQEQVLLSLHQNTLKINLDKCLFGDDQVSYLGFPLTPKGVKPGKAQLWAIRDAVAPTYMKSIQSFVGLCNFLDPYSKLHNHSSNLIPFHMPGIRIYFRDTSKSIERSIRNPPKSSLPRTNTGFPQSRQTICIHNQHLPSHTKTTQRSLRNRGTNQPKMSSLTHLANWRKMKKIIPLSTGTRSLSLGDGQL